MSKRRSMKATDKYFKTKSMRGKYNPAICPIITAFLLVLIAAWNINSCSGMIRATYPQILKKKICSAKLTEQKRLDKIYARITEEARADLPGIICWGDSLTAGAGGDGITYPLVLQEQLRENIFSHFSLENIADSRYIRLLDMERYHISEPEVLNMGVGGEDTNTILGRNGAVPFVTEGDFTIPADTVPVDIQFKSANGRKAAPLRQGNRGIDSVEICGIAGVIHIEQESYTSDTYSYTFIRNEAGNEVTVPSGTEVTTSGSRTGLEYLPVIFIGQNGGYEDIPDLIYQQRAIIDHQTDNQDRFIIVGLHTGTAEERAEMEAAMVSEYGDQYINLRAYLSEQGLADAGLEATEEDKKRMSQGMTPESLMIPDRVHFNADGYRVIGKLIYNRMEMLGYFDELKRHLLLP